ncbi:MAG: hypothetical protein EBZ86_09545, partial [Synechococcaceae bacterium WB9_2_069]|nr:hypothetical protein [Synechococcaceae bacterium WB9_2_069]
MPAFSSSGSAAIDTHESNLVKPYIAPNLEEITAAMGGLIQRVVGPFSLLGLLSITGCGVVPFSGDSKTAAWHRQLEFWFERGLAHPVD